jgi:hypothetical protein
MKNRRGKEGWAFDTFIFVSAGLFILYLLFIYLGGSASTFNLDISSSIKTYSESTSFETILPTGSFFKPIAGLLTYIFGGVPNMLADLSGQTSGAMIIICIWIIIVLMFGDIIKNLSFFSEKISWTIAVLMGIVGANLKFISLIAVFFTSIFIPLGIFAAYAGLFTAFVAFFAIELGISSLAPWLMRRKGLREEVKAEKGTMTIIDAIQHYKKVGKELASD